MQYRNNIIVVIINIKYNNVFILHGFRLIFMATKLLYIRVKEEKICQLKKRY